MTADEIEADYAAAVRRLRILAIARYLVEVMGAKPTEQAESGTQQSANVVGIHPATPVLQNGLKSSP